MYRYSYSEPLDIGDQRAENDRFLENYFVDINANSLIGSKKPTIVIGRKGSGKTALRLHFTKTISQNNLCVSIRPNETTINETYDFVFSREGQFAVEPISRIWYITTLFAITKTIISRNPSYKRTPTYKSIPSSIKEVCERDSIDEPIRNGRFSISEGLVATRSYIQSTNNRDQNLLDVLKELVSALVQKSDTEIYILIDSVDDTIHNTMDTTSRNDLFSTFFEGLMSFFRHFTNVEDNSLSSRVFLKIFIPTDIYNWSSGRHNDHVRQYKNEIVWDESQLEEFLTRRLFYNLPSKVKASMVRRDKIGARKKIDAADELDRDPEESRVWQAFLPESVTMVSADPKSRSVIRPVKKLLIRHTLMRPRDLMEIMAQIGRATSASKINFPTEETIIKALQSYSKELKKSVAEEYKHIYPRIDEILSAFSGRASRMPKEAMEELIGHVVGHNEPDIRKAINILLEACVIGSIFDDIDSGLPGKEKEIFFYDMSDVNALYNAKAFLIHEAFHHGLNVQPLRLRFRSVGA